jgi:hypothetical protein
LIDSATDYLVYTELVSGIDFAFFERRQIYHTLKDVALPPGRLRKGGRWKKERQGWR